MIIEFCGIPGGGKSTLSKAYSAHNTTVTPISLAMYHKGPTVFYAFMFALRNARSFVGLLHFVSKHHVQGLYWYSLHLMLRACAKYQKALCTPGISIIDEGIVHILLTLPRHSLTVEQMKSLVRGITLPNLLCVGREGTFHRFHRDDAHLHPRVKQGKEALAMWEHAVRTNTQTLVAVLAQESIAHIVFSARDTQDAVFAEIGSVVTRIP